ncbi:hypothetical protein QCA50_007098 [Cerrena zonata]|uniref:Uncharacterized protein n=1 Tax=Cerrena zonata TaxID=2478898 RepID=A0AAW0GH92_9APHY
MIKHAAQRKMASNMLFGSKKGRTGLRDISCFLVLMRIYAQLILEHTCIKRSHTFTKFPLDVVPGTLPTPEEGRSWLSGILAFLILYRLRVHDCRVHLSPSTKTPPKKPPAAAIYETFFNVSPTSSCADLLSRSWYSTSTSSLSNVSTAVLIGSTIIGEQSLWSGRGGQRAGRHSMMYVFRALFVCPFTRSLPLCSPLRLHGPLLPI